MVAAEKCLKVKVVTLPFCVCVYIYIKYILPLISKMSLIYTVLFLYNDAMGGGFCC